MYLTFWLNWSHRASHSVSVQQPNSRYHYAAHHEHYWNISTIFTSTYTRLVSCAHTHEHMACMHVRVGTVDGHGYCDQQKRHCLWHSWAISIDSKLTESKFVAKSINEFVVLTSHSGAYMCRSWNVEIFVLAKMVQPITLPLAHACRVINRPKDEKY